MNRPTTNGAPSLGVIFDVDGVLVDSYDAHFESWQLVGREEGFEFTERRFLETFGRTTREILAETFGESRFTPQQIATLDDRKEAIFRQLLSRDFPVMEGAIELIDQLHSAGYRLAVGSSGPPENVRLVLEELDRGPRFQGVVTGTDVTQGKPDPQVFLLGAERMGVAPGNCAVIEDAPAGIEAAHNAGMACIGLISKGHSREELARADHTAHSLRELSSDLVRQLLSADR